MKKDKIDIIIFFISKIIIGLLSLVSVTIYSKVLTTSEYGDYSLISGLCNALVSVFIGWIGSASLRYYIDYEKENKEKFYTNILLYSFVMTLLIVIIELFIGILSGKIPIFAYIFQVVFLTFSISFSEVFEKVFRASQKTLKYAISIIIQSIATVIFVVLSVRFISNGTSAMLLSVSSAKTIFIVLSLVFLGLSFKLKLNLIDKRMLKKFLKYGIPMIGVWGVSWLLNYCDRYIIAYFFDSSSVGIYDMSCKIAESSLNVIITSFTLAIYPILIRNWKEKGKKDVEILIKSIINYYFILIIPAVIGLICISNKLYISILDPKYVSGRMTIVIMSVGLALNGLTSIINKVWQLNEKTKKIFYIMLISVAFNLVLNIILIPHYGITMAAITTLASYILSLIITIIFVIKEFTLKIDFVSLCKTIIASIAMGAFILIFNKFVNNFFTFILEIIISIIIYGVLTILMNNINIKQIVKGDLK